MKNKFSTLIAFAGAADCVAVPILFGVALQQPIYPLPGLYFLEIALFGLLGLVIVAQRSAERSIWEQYASWGIAGILLAFNFLGAWTIGFYLLPGTLAFLVVGFLLTENTQKIWQGMGIFFVAAIAQGILMLALVNT